MSGRKHICFDLPVEGGRAVVHGDPKMSAESRAALHGIAQAAIKRLSGSHGWCGEREPAEAGHVCERCKRPAVALRRNTLVGGGHRRNVYWCVDHDDERAMRALGGDTAPTGEKP